MRDLQRIGARIAGGARAAHVSLLAHARDHLGKGITVQRDKFGDAVLGGAGVLVDGDQQRFLARRQVLVRKGLREQRFGPEMGAAQQVGRHLGQVEFLQGPGGGRAGGSGRGGHRASMKYAWRL
ncbi:hypothetical protein D3C87_1508980 [compost metagenome]